MVPPRWTDDAMGAGTVVQISEENDAAINENE
jgi:hypothetical protein